MSQLGSERVSTPWSSVSLGFVPIRLPRRSPATAGRRRVSTCSRRLSEFVVKKRKFVSARPPKPTREPRVLPNPIRLTLQRRKGAWRPRRFTRSNESPRRSHPCHPWLFAFSVAIFDLPETRAACQGSDREPESRCLLWNFSRAVLLHCGAAKVWGVWRV
jgi:hypothetical protein